jgi:hypothetical protein
MHLSDIITALQRLRNDEGDFLVAALAYTVDTPSFTPDDPADQLIPGDLRVYEYVPEDEVTH